MSDPIDRQAAIDAIFSEALYEPGMKKRDADAVVLAIFEKIKTLPSAQSQRKTGKWVHGKEIAREYLAGRITHIEYKDYHCSECGYTVENIRWNVDGELVDRYCTVCGAQMEVEE